MVMQKTTEEFVGGKAKSALKKGHQHHNFFGIRCWDVFPFHQPPLKHRTVEEEAILDLFDEFALIYGGWLEHLRMGSGHGVREENPKQED
jgi:hypothetical protein